MLGAGTTKDVLALKCDYLRSPQNPHTKKCMLIITGAGEVEVYACIHTHEHALTHTHTHS